jgi:hypothetical protein
VGTTTDYPIISSRNLLHSQALSAVFGRVWEKRGLPVAEDARTKSPERIRQSGILVRLRRSLDLPTCDHQPGVPAGCPPSCRRPNRLGVQAATGDDPGDHRVRVPHFSRSQLIATPDGSGHLADQAKQEPRTVLIGGQPPGAVNSLRDIRDVAVVPEPDLVAEDSKSARPASADCPFADHSTSLVAPVVDRRLLDHEPPVWDLDLERGVVQIARSPPRQSCRQRLVYAAVEADEVAAGAER